MVANRYALSAALGALRRSAGENASRIDLSVRLRTAQLELARLREQHRGLNAAAPSLPLPSLVDLVDTMDSLPPLVGG